MAKTKHPKTFKTATDVKNLAPEKGDSPKAYHVLDAMARGLRITVNPTGRKTWVYRYKVPGGKGYMRQMVLGTFPEMTLAQARAEMEHQKEIRKAGTDPVTARKAEITHQAAEVQEADARAHGEYIKTTYTVSSLISDYLRYASMTKKSWKADKRTLEKELDAIMDMPAHDVTKAQVKKLLDGIFMRGSPVMANRTLAAIRGMYNVAIEKDWPEGNPITVNPCWQIKKLADETPRERHLVNGEIKKFLVNLPKTDMPEQYQDLLKFILATGCRIGEACHMKWSEISLTDNTWTQPGEKTKNSRQHIVFLSPYAKALLKAKKASRAKEGRARGYVWGNPKSKVGHVLPESVNSALADAMPALKVDKFTPHDLRRSLATWLGESEVDEKVHDRMLNHYQKSIRSTYNQAKMNAPAKTWWNKWGRYLEGLESGTVIPMKADG